MYGPRRQNITKLLSLELMIAGWCLWCCKSSPNQLPDVTCPNRASAVEHCRLQVVHPLSVQPTGSAPPLPIPMIRGCRSGLGYQSTGGRPISNHLKSWCREGAAARLPWLEYLRKMWGGDGEGNGHGWNRQAAATIWCNRIGESRRRRRSPAVRRMARPSREEPNLTSPL